MSHDELRERLLDLAYGELSPREAREVEAHAEGCEACRAELAAIRGTRQVMSALPVEPAPERGRAVLVAAAREAVRARPPRGKVGRWLWAGPVLAASLAVVVVVSVRVGERPPPSAGREDPDALLGERRYAEPAPAAPPAVPPAAPREAPAVAAAPAPAPSAPPRGGARREAPRFATAPEADAPAPPAAVARAPAPEPAPSERAREEHAGKRAEALGAPEAAGAIASAAPAAPAPRPAPAAPSGAGAMASGAADLEARREAAPARRMAKALAAPEGAAPAPPDRAVAAACAHARSLGVDPAGMDADAGPAPVTWDAWRARAPAGLGSAAVAALQGRRFWVVRLVAGPGGGDDLVVLVEDGTFRPLAELRGR